MDIGVAVIDSFTHNILQYLETIGKTSRNSLQEFASRLSLSFCNILSECWQLIVKIQFSTYDPAKILSHPGISTSLSNVPPEQILITDFFGAVARVEVSPQSAGLPLESRLIASKDGWEPTNLGIDDGSITEEIPEVLPRKMEEVKKGSGEWNQPLVVKTSEWGFLLPYLIGAVSFIWLYISLGDKEEDREEVKEKGL